MKVRTYRKRNLLLTILTAACCLCCGFGFTLASAKVSANASASESFALEQGASVLVADDYQKLGIRYTFSTDEASYEAYKAQNAQFGIIIVPEDTITAGREINAANVFGIGGTAIYDWAKWNGSEWDTTIEEGKIRIANFYTSTLTELLDAEGNSNGNWGFYGSITNLKEQNLTREFRGYAYVKVGETVEFYTHESNLRSMTYVAQRAVESNGEADFVTALEEAYLDKVADRNTTYKVKHHKMDGDVEVGVETETITAAIGLEVSDKQKMFAGYKYDENNANAKTSGIVYANGKLTLDYYYNAVEAVTVTEQFVSGSTLSFTDVTAANAPASGFEKTMQITASGWTNATASIPNLASYLEVKFAIKTADSSKFYSLLFDGEAVGNTEWGNQNTDWITVSLKRNGEVWDVYFDGTLKKEGITALTNVQFAAATFYATEVKGFIDPAQVVSYVTIADQIVSGSTLSFTDVTAANAPASGFEKTMQITASGWTNATASIPNLASYLEVKFAIKTADSSKFYSLLFGSEAVGNTEWGNQNTGWLEVGLKRNGEVWDVYFDGTLKKEGITALTNIQFAAATYYMTEVKGVKLSAEEKVYTTVTEEILAPAATLAVTDVTTTNVPANGFDKTLQLVASSWTKGVVSDINLANYEEVKFAIKASGKFYNLYFDDAAVGTTQWGNNNTSWLIVSLKKNGEAWDVYFDGNLQKAGISSFDNIVFDADGTCYITEMKGLASTAHTHVYETVVLKNATCTENGELEKTCTLCGESVKEEITELKTHKYMTSTINGVKTSTCVYCGDVQIEDVNANPDAELVEEELIVAKDLFSQCVLDADGNVVEGATNKDNFWDTPSGVEGYRMYLSNIANSDADYYRYFRAIINVDFTQYESVTFKFVINQVQGGGVGFNVKLGGVVYNLTEAGTYEVTITKLGAVSINGTPLEGAQMSAGQIVIDLDTCATGLNYRCIDVYKTFNVVKKK